MLKNIQDKSTSIKVFIRVRPLTQTQNEDKQTITVQADNKTININNNTLSTISIKFDQALSQQSTQKQIYTLFTQYIQKIIQGYNITIFAYGQTGSGKTYTMFGKDWQIDQNKKYQNTYFDNIDSDQNYVGIIPRAIYQLFKDIQIQKERKNNFKIFCSFLQIYNDKIYDLLQDFKRPKPLELHQSKIDGIFVQGLAEYNVSHYLDCLQLMKKGQKNRYIRQTSMNAKSSRSHTIFQILVQSTQSDKKGMFKKAKLNLCDLAGSQKINKNQIINNQHFKQLKNINQSLSTLGKVIANLSNNKSLPPFRQSKLTRLLQDSLTLNTFTFIIGNISPSINNIDQTMNTLKFVQRARHIVMKIKPMQFNGQNLDIVNKLTKQIQYLKELLNLKRKGYNSDDIHTKLLSLQEENQKLRKTSISFKDIEKLLEENRYMKNQLHKLQLSQYSLSEDADNRSQISLNSKRSLQKQSSLGDILNKSSQGNIPGFSLPQHRQSPKNIQQQTRYSPNIKKSFINAGINSIDPTRQSNKSFIQNQQKKQKAKILIKLQELQRIQKQNQEKLLRNLQQIDRKSMHKIQSVAVNPVNPSWKKILPTQGSKDKQQNYQDKIRQLEAKLFGK